MPEIDYERLDGAREMACSYSELAMHGGIGASDGMQSIVEKAASFSPLEMAYFCQQVVSYCLTATTASAVLTVFTNRLSTVKECQ